MILTVMLTTYTASSMALAIAISPRMDYLTTLIMNLYFAFMLVSIIYASVRGKYSLCSFLCIHLSDKISWEYSIHGTDAFRRP